MLRRIALTMLLSLYKRRGGRKFQKMRRCLSGVVLNATVPLPTADANKLHKFNGTAAC